MAMLQTRTNRRVGDRTYHKHELIIPEEFVRELGWSENQSVDFRRYGGNKLLLVPTAPSITQPKLTFEVFAAAVTKALKETLVGLTWTEIRRRTGLPQRTPNPTWVYRLERDHGLHRIRNGKNLQTVWLIEPAARR
jgi:bifunctional DNA-binding transcriptional regulator/antitoxin component of YhaV-PrlF toxin-antitoxin module